MVAEKYIIQIGEKGSEGLGKLDYLFNKTTQEFLLKSGLKAGMSVLDIGCGSGVMTRWMAEYVGEQGLVVGIENDENQLNAAKRASSHLSATNIKFELCSAYDIDKLDETFDFVYCRFVLHHLHEPVRVISHIYDVLKPKGIYAAEEGIVNFAFSYPHSYAWGTEGKRLEPVWADVPPNNRDPNIGVKMVTKMRRAGFNIIDTRIVHPVMSTREEKQFLLLGIEEMKDFYLSEGHTEDQWIQYVKDTEEIVNQDDQIAGFFASMQVSGVKV